MHVRLGSGPLLACSASAALCPAAAVPPACLRHKAQPNHQQAAHCHPTASLAPAAGSHLANEFEHWVEGEVEPLLRRAAGALGPAFLGTTPGMFTDALRVSGVAQGFSNEGSWCRDKGAYNQEAVASVLLFFVQLPAMPAFCEARGRGQLGPPPYPASWPVSCAEHVAGQASFLEGHSPQAPARHPGCTAHAAPRRLPAAGRRRGVGGARSHLCLAGVRQPGLPQHNGGQ